MTTLNFTLPIPGISINAVYCRDRRFKTTKYNEWEQHFFHHYAKHSDAVTAFASQFQPLKHVMKLSLVFGVHRQSFYTKAGTVSAFSMDLSNCEKVVLDCLMLKKYQGRGGATVIGHDDKFVTTLHSSKVPADSFYIDVAFEIVDKPT